MSLSTLLLVVALNGAADLRVIDEGAAAPVKAAPGAGAARLAVHTDFEGASARVEAIDQAHRVVRFRPAGDPARGWPCWWSFRLSGIRPGETIRLELVADTVVCLSKFNPLHWIPDRPSLSTDGKTWRPFDADGRREAKQITWTQKIDAAEARLAWGPPFTPADAAALVERLAKKPCARPFELCRSREGRPVHGLIVEEKAAGGGEPRCAAWIEARQHAWEIGGSWACQGLMEWLTGDDPRAVELRKKCTFYLVPVMDVDNVATGDGGKNQIPHDHNRDWSDDPHFPAVRAAQERIRGLVQSGRMDLFIDLHDPERGAREAYYFFPPREILSPRATRNHERLMEVSKAEITGPIGLRPEARETGIKYDPKMWKWMSKNWVVRNAPGHAVAVTLEIAWNTPGSTAEGYMTLGRQLGLALERYFREEPRRP